MKRLLAIGLFWCGGTAMAAQCIGVWEQTLQAHGTGIQLAYGVGLAESDPVPTETLNQSSWWGGCNGEACQATGEASSSLHLPAFVYSDSDNHLSVQALQTQPVVVRESVRFGTVEVAYGSRIEFDGSVPLRLIDRLRVGVLGEVRLPPGDYWINELDVQAYGRIETLGTGPVRLWVSQRLSFGYGAELVSGPQTETLVFSYEDMDFGGRNRIDGWLYGRHSAYLGAFSELRGRLAAADAQIGFAAQLSDTGLTTPEALNGVCSDAGPLADTDGDGRPDGVDPDADDDGYFDFAERQAGSDPFDHNSVPQPSQGSDLPDLPDAWDPLDANACTNTFTNGLQTHTSNGVIQFGYNAQLVHPSSFGLLTQQIEQPPFTQDSHCDTGACYALGQPSSPLPPVETPELQGTETYRVRPNAEQALASSDSQRFKLIRVQPRGVLDVDSESALFRAGDVWLQSRATLRLTPGDYFFDSLQIDPRASLEVEGQGTVRIHLDNELSVLSRGRINSTDAGPGDPAQVLINARGDVDINYQAEVSALVYTDQSLVSQGTVHGALSAARISLYPFAQVFYDADAVWHQDFGTYCDIDGDGTYDGRDPDRDGDGISNDYEKELGFDPNDPNSTPPDLDGDGIPDALDDDRDGDGYLNDNDHFPDDPTEWADMDNDGIGDHSDPDRDGDGFDNDDETQSGTDPNDATDYPDRVPPTVSIAPLPSWTRLSQYELKATAADDYSGLQSVSVRNETTDQTTVMEAGEADVWLATPTLAEGLNTLTVTATDNWGNQATATATLNRDSTAPTLTLLEPQSTLWVGDDHIEVVYRATDDNSGVQSVVVLTPTFPVQPVVDGDEYRFDVPLLEGENAFNVRATDHAGNQSITLFTIGADLTAPDFVSLDTPELVSVPAFNLTGLVRDNLTDITLTLVVNGQPVPVTSEPDSDGLHFFADLALTEGGNEVVLTARDAADNTRTETRHIRLDTQAPEIQLDPLAAAWQIEPEHTFTGRITDTNSGVASLVYQLGTQAGTVTLDDDGRFSLSLTLTEGEQTLMLVASDQAGNERQGQQTIGLDTTLPTLEPDQPAERLTGEPEQTLSGTVSDAGSGVASVTLSWPTGSEPVPVPLNVGAFATTLTVSEGTQTGQLIVTDALGNARVWPFSVTGDFSAPTIQTSPPDGYLTNQPELNVHVDLTDTPAGVQQGTLNLNGVEHTLQAGANPLSLTLQEGDNDVTLAATDKVGNATGQSLHWRLDSQAPLMEPLVEPGLWVGEPSLTLEYAITDANSGVDSAWVDLPDGPRPMTAQGDVYSTDVTLVEGDNLIQVAAQDKAGNQAQDSVLIQADFTAPVFSQLSVPLLVSDPSLTVTGLASDALSGVPLVALSLNGQPQPLSTSVVSGGTAFSADVTLTEGDNTLELTAQDALGNEQQLTYSLMLDTQAPVIELEQPTPYWRSDDTVQISGVMTDPTSGLDTLSYEWAGVSHPLTLTSDGQFNLTLTLQEGANSLTVTATDRAENTARASVSVGLDTQPPTLVPDQADHLVTGNDTVTLSGRVEDAGSGVAQLVLHRDDQPDPISISLVDGQYSHSMALAEGTLTGTLVVTDQVGLSAEWHFTVLQDATAPVITLTPEDGLLTNQTTVTAEWTLTEDGSGPADQTITLNGTPQPLAISDRAYTLTLQEGANAIALNAKDAAGNVGTASATWHLDTQAPELDWLSDTDATNDPDYAVSVGILDANGIDTVQLTANGQSIDTQLQDDHLTATVTLQQGNNALALSVVDAAGNETSLSRSVFLDSEPPVIELTAVDSPTAATEVMVQGRVTDASEVQVSLSGQAAAVAEDGQFTLTVPLQPGGNTLTVQALDALGNLAQQSLTVTSDQSGPEVSWTAPAVTDQDILTLSGSVTDDYADVARLQLINTSLGGTAFEATLNAGAFTLDIALAAGVNDLVWIAEDSLGNASQTPFNLERLATQLSWSWLSHTPGQTVTEDSVIVEGLLTTELTENEFSVTLNGAPARLSPWAEGEWVAQSQSMALVEGDNLVEVHVQAADAELHQTLLIVHAPNNEPPQDSTLALTLNTPLPGTRIASEWLTVSGELESSSHPNLTLNGAAVSLQASAPYYRFNHTLAVPTGLSEWALEFSATNEEGVTQSLTRTVIIDHQAPVLTLERQLAEYPAVNDVLENPYPFSGTVTDDNLSTLTLNGQVVALTPLAEGQYRFDVPLSLTAGSEATLELSAVDLSGNRTTEAWVVHASRSLDLSWLLPGADSRFVTQGEPFPLQLVLHSSSTAAADYAYRARWVETTTETASDWQTLNRAQATVSGELMLSGEVGDYRLDVQALDANETLVTQAQPRTFKVREPDVVEVAVVRTTPEANAQNVETKDAIGVFFNQPIEPDQLTFQVFETAQGKTWLNLDAPGTEFFSAQGHQLVDVSRNHEAVPGTVRVLPERKGFLFQPAREPAYGATLSVEVRYQGVMMARYQYQTEALPTLVSLRVEDQYQRPLNGIRVRLGDRETVTREGWATFGYGDGVTPLPGGDYTLWVNPNLTDGRYGETRLTLAIEGGRNNELGTAMIPFLNPEVGSTYLESGHPHSLLGGALTLDATHATLTFRNGRSEGPAHVQFNTQGGINYPTHPLIAPNWLYSVQPLGIELEGSAAISFELPQLNNGLDYLPDEGTLGLLLGVNPRTERIEPLGLVQRQQNRAVVLPGHRLTVLDHLGAVFLPEVAQPLLESYQSGEISLEVLMIQLAELASEPNTVLDDDS